MVAAHDPLAEAHAHQVAQDAAAVLTATASGIELGVMANQTPGCFRPGVFVSME
jgi:hypothetical protein